jgi:transcription-repair coupling factor (superfamily II helicase)
VRQDFFVAALNGGVLFPPRMSEMKKALETFFSDVDGAGGVSDGQISVSSLSGASDAFLALYLANRNKENIVLAVTSGIPDADRLAGDLELLCSDKSSPFYSTRILELPVRIDSEFSSIGLRLKTLSAIRAWAVRPYPAIVVAPVAALLSPVAAESAQCIILDLNENKTKKISELVERFVSFGYRRVPSVESEGDFAVRGGILDIWSPGEEFPVRAEFFGDEIESLRSFNAATQLSVERISSASFLSLEDDAAKSPKSVSVLDIMPKGAAALLIDHNSYSLTLSDAFTGPKVYTGDPPPRGVETIDFTTSALPGFSELGADACRHPELFDSAKKRLDIHMASAKAKGKTHLALDELSGGFETQNLIVVTKSDRVFAKRKTRLKASRYTTGARLSDFDDLEPGEYVVHIDHGVGRYVGSSEITVDGRRSEVFTIEYADGGKLHVPASHAHLLSRYVGIKGEAVKLHRLDGKRWDKDKRDAEKAVADLAASLIETQAKREMIPGFAYDIECEGLDAFEAAFAYEETVDQAAAIEAVKKDLASSKPMDRLICGDAGYGKTEVAMRAAYIAAMNGKQVALLAPTTVLAEQHFETFTSRFDGTPIRIESMSRFQSRLVHQGTFDRLHSGACDIVIGTHAILSSKIRFHDLGLVIIDEEQRFGVRHKEFLKRLRTTADVLTLSATPIPRTLYLSMTGARDLSLLRTPPKERVAVETNIVRDSDMTVKAAIESEIARAGQVFFLHNRVSTIETVKKRLQKLCPSIRIVVAHGRMDSKTLARKMRDFERGEYDLLLSTTIIESGIDIPRANTILIDRADCFGMAEIYQLRGRVGRSSRQGRAYFLLPPSGDIDSDARERLAALKRHGSLGSGFNLAVRDLEIRGAGNLLGSQQSGHIAAVGFTLYCQLLSRTVAILKGEKPPEIIDVKLNFDFIDFSPASEDDESAASLPYTYVEEDSQRMGYLKRFAEASSSSDVKKLRDELKDRYGPPPAAAIRFFKLAQIRLACQRSSIGSIDVSGDRAVFRRRGTSEIVMVTELKGSSPDRKLAQIIKECSAQKD